MSAGQGTPPEDPLQGQEGLRPEMEAVETGEPRSAQQGRRWHAGTIRREICQAVY